MMRSRRKPDARGPRRAWASRSALNHGRRRGWKALERQRAGSISLVRHLRRLEIAPQRREERLSQAIPSSLWPKRPCYGHPWSDRPIGPSVQRHEHEPGGCRGLSLSNSGIENGNRRRGARCGARGAGLGHCARIGRPAGLSGRSPAQQAPRFTTSSQCEAPLTVNVPI